MTSHVRPVVLKILEPNLPAGKKTPAAVQSAWARTALQKSAAAAKLTLSSELTFDPLGAPVPQNGVFWSLTHKPLWVGAVASKGRPVGIDIEKIENRKNERTYEYVANESEWALTGERNLENFFRIWTAKEAALKALGTGLRELSQCQLQSFFPRRSNEASLTLRCRNQDWSIHQIFWDDHMASVTNYGEDVVWTITSDSTR